MTGLVGADLEIGHTRSCELVNFAKRARPRVGPHYGAQSPGLPGDGGGGGPAG